MSDLQKAFVKARLAKLPPDIPVLDENENEDSSASRENNSTIEEEDDLDSSSTSSASSAGTIVPSAAQNLFARPSL